MSELLAQVAASQADLLGPGEGFLFAAKTERKGAALNMPMGGGDGRWHTEHIQPNPPTIRLTNFMIWALSNRRLFIWTTGVLSRSKPRDLLCTLELGSDARNASADEQAPTAGYGKTYLHITIHGTVVTVAISTSDARHFEATFAAAPPPPPPA